MAWRRGWRDNWFAARVIARGPLTVRELADIAPVCNHPSVKPLLDAAATAANGQPVADPIGLAHVAAVWATEIEALTQDDSSSGLMTKHRTSVVVLTQALHGVEEAAHALALSHGDDVQAAAELHVRLARMVLAYQPLLYRYMDLLRRLHATSKRVDPTRD